jgi:Predicted phosphoesterases, related to the Icc protein
MPERLRIAAIADLHYTKHCKGRLLPIFRHASQSADVLCLCGDLTDYGLPEEAELLAHDLTSSLSIPCLAVLGNHDFESGHAEQVTAVLEAAGIQVLDGESVTIEGVRFAGVCGFGGGFEGRMLNAWGEPMIKAFVQEAVDHALRLEKALARGQEERKVALLHYSPVRATVMGEEPEIFAFLGSTRLEGPLNRQQATAAFHGHAHRGEPFGTTSSGVPVYNVSLPVLERAGFDGAPVRVVEV